MSKDVCQKGLGMVSALISEGLAQLLLYFVMTDYTMQLY